MAIRKLKVARIGNSRGVRLPAEVLKRYRIGGFVVMEERTEGILLRPAGPAVEKLSWKETAREMAASGEDWIEWDGTAADGLADLPWDDRSLVHEKKPRYQTKPRTRKRQ